MDVERFFLNYWLFFLVIFLLLIFLTRSFLKQLINFILLGLGVFLFWSFVIAPGFTKLDQCFKQEERVMASFNGKVKQISSENERKNILCQEGAASFVRLTGCLNSVQGEKQLSFVIYSLPPKFKQTLLRIMGSHNSYCPEIPLSYPF